MPPIDVSLIEDILSRSTELPSEPPNAAEPEEIYPLHKREEKLERIWGRLLMWREGLAEFKLDAEAERRRRNRKADEAKDGKKDREEVEVPEAVLLLRRKAAALERRTGGPGGIEKSVKENRKKMSGLYESSSAMREWALEIGEIEWEISCLSEALNRSVELGLTETQRNAVRDRRRIRSAQLSGNSNAIRDSRKLPVHVSKEVEQDTAIDWALHELKQDPHNIPPHQEPGKPGIRSQVKSLVMPSGPNTTFTDNTFKTAWGRKIKAQNNRSDRGK